MERIVVRAPDLKGSAVRIRDVQASFGFVGSPDTFEAVFVEIQRHVAILLKVAILSTGPIIVFDPKKSGQTWVFELIESDKCIQHLYQLMDLPHLFTTKPE